MNKNCDTLFANNPIIFPLKPFLPDGTGSRVAVVPGVVLFPDINESYKLLNDITYFNLEDGDFLYLLLEGSVGIKPKTGAIKAYDPDILITCSIDPQEDRDIESYDRDIERESDEDKKALLEEQKKELIENYSKERSVFKKESIKYYIYNEININNIKLSIVKSKKIINERKTGIIKEYFELCSFSSAESFATPLFFDKPQLYLFYSYSFDDVFLENSKSELINNNPNIKEYSQISFYLNSC
jgi:hypothetical protein